MKAYYYENNAENGIMLVSGDRFIAFGTVFRGSRELTVTRENIPQIVTDIEEWYFDESDFNDLFKGIESDNNDLHTTAYGVAGRGAVDAVEAQDVVELIYVSRDDPESEDEGEDDEPDEDEEDDEDDEYEEVKMDYDYLIDALNARFEKLATRILDLTECGRKWERKAFRYESEGNTRRMKECERKADEFYTLARSFKDAARVLGFCWCEDHFVFDI